MMALLLISIPCRKINAQPDKKIIVDLDRPHAEIQPTMWGAFFEDINMSADGGMYAELIKNRSFEFFRPMMGWHILGTPKTEGDFTILNRQQDNAANPRFLRVTLHDSLKPNVGLSNEGFRGIGVKSGNQYQFSMMYRCAATSVKIRIELVNEKGEKIAESFIQVNSTGNEWKTIAASLVSSSTSPKARLKIWFEGEGSIDLDMLSLFPMDTWKNRPGGLRSDMMQMLADMKPGFLRFPGGCIVEGYDLSQRYQWKKTIGPVDQRPVLINRWNFEDPQRQTPDYFQTFGLGFFEYFQMAEDLGAEPLPILNAGMACQFNSAELVPIPQLDPYIQDALDLIEFANGDSTSVWGKKRAGLGHPQPFQLKIMGIGNENWGPQYVERLKLFIAAIRARYPEIKVVCSSGTDPNGGRFDYLNGELRKIKADIIDEHYYQKPEWFLRNASRYDHYDRNGPKIFVGEYAATPEEVVTPPDNNSWKMALAEAAFMTGLERNADVVYMASYAPLFAHLDGWQCPTDLIWMDNLHVYGTPNYFVQKLFSTNKGTRVVNLFQHNEPLTGQDSLYGSAVVDEKASELIIKLINVSGKRNVTEIEIKNLNRPHFIGKVTILNAEGISEYPLKVAGKPISLSLAPSSFTVVRIPWPRYRKA